MKVMAYPYVTTDTKNSIIIIIIILRRTICRALSSVFDVPRHPNNVLGHPVLYDDPPTTGSIAYCMMTLRASFQPEQYPLSIQKPQLVTRNGTHQVNRVLPRDAKMALR